MKQIKLNVTVMDENGEVVNEDVLELSSGSILMFKEQLRVYEADTIRDWNPFGTYEGYRVMCQLCINHDDE